MGEPSLEFPGPTQTNKQNVSYGFNTLEETSPQAILSSSPRYVCTSIYSSLYQDLRESYLKDFLNDIFENIIDFTSSIQKIFYVSATKS